jgi:hypothetical protein
MCSATACSQSAIGSGIGRRPLSQSATVRALTDTRRLSSPAVHPSSESRSRISVEVMGFHLPSGKA